jgi:cohesin domain-containing protein
MQLVYQKFLSKMNYLIFQMIIKKLFMCFAAFSFFLVLESAAAAEPTLYIPPLKVQSGQSLKVPVKIDQVEKLAGIKLVVEYDLKYLVYEKVDKSPTTSSLMHVVNDKNPGKLIIVMAGAKGVSGRDFEIINIHFKAGSGLKNTSSESVRITEVELVSEELKNIPSLIRKNASVNLHKK